MTGVLRVQGRRPDDDSVVDVLVRGDRVVDLAPAGDRPDVGGPDLLLAPGLVDLQVNGFGGHDINSPTVEPTDVVAVLQSLWATGVTHFCPTVTTGSAERMERSLAAIAAACSQSEMVEHAVLGIHLEGPYLSPEDGPRGAHPREHVRLPDLAEFRRFQAAAGGRIRLVTLAPELPGALPLIQQLVSDGVLVTLGHHAATTEQIAAAVAAGARMSTHLGNGAHAVLPRHPNYLWDQLARDELCASVIADGHHLPPAVVRCFARAKGLERLVLVSDASAPAGLPAGRYEQMGAAVDLSADGRLSLSGTPFLAGAALPLIDGVANLCRFADVPLPDAIRAASLRPATLLGAADAIGGLHAGASADLLLFRRHADGKLAAEATISRGQIVFRRDGDGAGDGSG